ncbi:tyrosine-type recombinase/integrase [Nocardia sp. NPDC048505]|uniref:tyrosine-type recombinase/integrase n=1 Tax=unclassified Nocardia TaxID=2637762 RepID=UPI0033E3013E
MRSIRVRPESIVRRRPARRAKRPLKQHLASRRPEAEVFTSNRGAVLRVRNMRRDWRNDAAKAAGLAGLTPHELRHTAAVSQGASVLALQRMLGHDKPSTTLDFYADLFDDDNVAAKLDSARTKFATAYPTEFGGRRPDEETA